jgi:ABC-2 type transport system ATP-binding protein
MSNLGQNNEVVPSCISIKNVNKFFSKKQVLHDINLDVPYSKIFGLLGPSGSGKTTMVKMIAGIETSTTGSVYLLDYKMPNLSAMGKIGYMSQLDALYLELTAEENMVFFSSLYGLKGAEQKKRILEVMELVNLTEDLKRPVKVYSGGMRRRLSLAIALLHNPGVLILDEPTVGIDPLLRKSIWDELNVLRDNGTSILLTTHVMDEAEKCDTLAMLRDGKLIAVGSPEELKSNTSSDTLEKAFLHYGGALV